MYTSVGCQQPSSQPSQSTDQESVQKVKMTDEDLSTAPSNQNASYGDDMVKVFHVYKNLTNPKRDLDVFEKSIQSVKNKSLRNAGMLVLELGKPDHNLFSDQFLKKPSIETMQAMHQIKMLMWNSFTTEVFDVKQNLKSINLEGLSESELLANYYIFIFNKIAIENVQKDYSNFNFDFQKLNLETPEEKAILYFTSLRAYDQKYNFQFRNTLNPCAEAKKVIAKTPRYQGKTFAEFDIPLYQNFTIRLNRQSPNQNFADYFKSSYDKMMENYNKCP